MERFPWFDFLAPGRGVPPLHGPAVTRSAWDSQQEECGYTGGILPQYSNNEWAYINHNENMGY